MFPKPLLKSANPNFPPPKNLGIAVVFLKTQLLLQRNFKNSDCNSLKPLFMRYLLLNLKFPRVGSLKKQALKASGMEMQGSIKIKHWYSTLPLRSEKMRPWPHCSELRAERAGAGVWKLAVFYGYLL